MSNDDKEGNSGPKIAFGFSKKKESKLDKTLVRGAVDEKEKETKDYVGHFDKNEKRAKKEKEELVIPMIEVNRWRGAVKPEDLEKDDAADDGKPKNDQDGPANKKARLDTEAATGEDSEAVKEILQDAARFQDGGEDEEYKKKLNMSIPILMRNKAPEGAETDDKLDTSIRPDEAKAADYDQVPIEAFGKALLRGMGWKEGQGIGRNNELVKPVDAVLRPKGLGLGADRSVAKQKADSAGGGGGGKSEGGGSEDGLVMKKGSCCRVTHGRHTDLYGQIEGTDEDNARAVVKLTLSGEQITISQLAIKLVGRKEYDKYSKYLNKGKVDKYKDRESKKNKQENHSHDSDSDSDDSDHHHKHRDKKSRHRDHKESRRDHRDRHSNKHSDERDHESHRDSDRDRHKDRKHREHKDRRKHNKGDREKEEQREPKKSKDKQSSSSVSNGSSKQQGSWLRPHLRVRVVDEKYKKGKYFKTKVVIEDVVTVGECICKTDEGRVLEGLTQDMLETVIPKAEPAHVMLVAGKKAGQLGEILKKDKATYKATVQLFSDRDVLLEMDYDQICEYAGDVNKEFDY